MSDFASSVDKIYQDGISCKIKEIDDIIKQLNKIRDSIYRLYEEHISQKINHFYDQQNKYAMDSMTLKKHLENI